MKHMWWFDDKTDDLLDKPETAYIELEESSFKAEQDLAEKYRSFVTEMLRLSLAGIAVFAFLDQSSHGSLAARVIAGFGVLFLAGSIGFSLWFLFGASEGLRWYIAGSRYYSDKSGHVRDNKTALKMLDRRIKIIQQCRHSKFGAALLLASGAFCMAAATAWTLVMH
jgi:hypothetical protein